MLIFIKIENMILCTDNYNIYIKDMSETKLFVKYRSEVGEVLHDGTILYNGSIFTELSPLIQTIANLPSRPGASYFSHLFFHESDDPKTVIGYYDICEYDDVVANCNGQQKIKNIYDLLKGKIGYIKQRINLEELERKEKIKKDLECGFDSVFDAFIEYVDNMDFSSDQTDWLDNRRMEIVKKLLAVTNTIAHGSDVP